MLITPERKVPQRSDASQNDHNALGTRLFIKLFLKSGSTALVLRLSITMHDDYDAGGADYYDFDIDDPSRE